MDGDVGGEEAVNARLSMVKDENGFVYYRCRFCGLTFNFMTTLKAHERVHDVMQVRFADVFVGDILCTRFWIFFSYSYPIDLPILPIV